MFVSYFAFVISPRIRKIASSYSLNTHITGFSVVNKMFLLVGTNGSILIFKYTLPGRRQPILRLWLDERVVAMWVHRSPFTLFPKLSSRDFEPAKTDRELLVVRFVTPDSGVHTKPRGYLGRVLVTTTPIFDFLTKQYPPGTILNPGEWRRSILLLEYLPLPGLLGHMAFFVSGTRMVLPVGEEDGECVKYVECNFDPRWAMFVDWMARCGDEVARGWTIKNRGPFIVSSRSFRAPRTTAVAITYDHKVVSIVHSPSLLVARLIPPPVYLLQYTRCRCTSHPRLTTNLHGALSVFFKEEGWRVMTTGSNSYPWKMTYDVYTR